MAVTHIQLAKKCNSGNFRRGSMFVVFLELYHVTWRRIYHTPWPMHSYTLFVYNLVGAFTYHGSRCLGPEIRGISVP